MNQHFLRIYQRAVFALTVSTLYANSLDNILGETVALDLNGDIQKLQIYDFGHLTNT